MRPCEDGLTNRPWMLKVRRMHVLKRHGIMLAAFLGWAATSPGAETSPTDSAPNPPPPPPPSSGATEVYRLRSLDVPTRKRVEYDGALMRLRKRVEQRQSKESSEQRKYRQAMDNVSVDPVTGRGQGICLFSIKF
jgi:hypothetical protein